MKTRKKSLPDEKKNPETLPISWQKLQYISFWRKTSKNKKYCVVAGIFHKHAITKHSRIRYQNTHKLIDLRTKKNGNDSVNFIGSFDNYGMSNILDILLLAACLRLTQAACLRLTQAACLRLTQAACLRLTQAACLRLTQAACLRLSKVLIDDLACKCSLQIHISISLDVAART